MLFVRGDAVIMVSHPRLGTLQGRSCTPLHPFRFPQPDEKRRSSGNHVSVQQTSTIPCNEPDMLFITIYTKTSRHGYAGLSEVQGGASICLLAVEQIVGLKGRLCLLKNIQPTGRTAMVPEILSQR